MIINNNPLENQQVIFPIETTTSTLSQYYPQLNQSWEIATQKVDIEGNIVSREYSIPSFPSYESKLVKVDLNVYDPDWEANFYYMIIGYFDETSYTSTSDLELPFNEWQRRKTKFRQEVFYKHKKVSELVWNRPTTSLPNVLPITYSPLVNDYTLLVNVGTALGAAVIVNSPVEVRLKNTEEEAGELVNKDFILLTKPYLEIKFKSITINSHTQVTINFYGEYYVLSYAPANLISQEETITLIHPFNIPYLNRLKPPGLPNLPDNFWNTNYNNLPDLNLTNRGNTPVWI